MDGAVLALSPCVFPGQLYLCLYLAIVDSVCIYKFNYIKFKGHVNNDTSLPTMLHLHYKLLKWLTLYREVISLECEHHKKRIKTLCIQSVCVCVCVCVWLALCTKWSAAIYKGIVLCLQTASYVHILRNRHIS